MKQPHICLDESLGIFYAVLPGDPARIDRIASLLEHPEELTYNREFRSLRGTYKGVNILAISTGIGGCSAGIAVEELHNIGVKAMIRTGSCGALQKNIGLGELIIVSGAVRDDGASKAYVPECFPAYADIELLSCVINAAEKNAWLKLASNAGPSVGTNPVTALNVSPIIRKKTNESGTDNSPSNTGNNACPLEIL